MDVEQAVPTLRGVSHKYAAFVALPAGIVLVSLAPTGGATLAAAIYALTLCALLTISALYHRREWSERARRRMRRLDHSMIFVFIAGSFTPFAMLALEPSVGTALMAAMWGTALAGLLFKQMWLDAPSWLGAALYVAAGCVVVPYTNYIVDGIGVVGTCLLAVGGLFYIAGAAVYAVRWPNPTPASFGYHEVFHLFVLAGVVVHYVAIAGYALGIG